MAAPREATPGAARAAAGAGAGAHDGAHDGADAGPGAHAGAHDGAHAGAQAWGWHRAGDDGLLLDLSGAGAVARVASALVAAPPDGVVDVVPAARTVLVRGGAHAWDAWAAAVRALAEAALDGRTAAAASSSAPPRVVPIPVVYDGEDVAEVARLAGLSTDEVVARHAAACYRVAFGGFMPGFAYLTGLDPALVVPRLATPRTRVPAGAVAVAGEYSAVYPRATPGGWRLLGRTRAVMFDPSDDDRPALLEPGDEVRFVPERDALAAGPVPAAGEVAGGPDGRARVPADTAVPPDEPTDLPDEPVGVPDDPVGAPDGPAGVPDDPASEHSDGRRAAGVRRRPGRDRPGGWGHVEVLATGPLVLVEDAGRPGLAAVGVPRSGAADPRALRAANRLVGNRAGAAALEMVLGGLVVRFATTTAFALVGAPAPATLDGTAVPPGRAVRAPAGAVLEVGVPARGLRTWLAVRGGLAAAPVLGSRSTDVLSGLGPARIAAGDVLPLGTAFDGLPQLGPDGVPQRRPDGTREAAVPPADVAVVLPATWGPRRAWLDDESRDRLRAQEWAVAADSNRVALRCDGPALARGRDDELPSEGLVLGAVQVPHDGQPLLFGPDHPVTGGYPVVAVLTAEGIGRAAQCRPGDRVRLALGPAGRV